MRVLPNDAMKRSKLERHLQSKHPDIAKKPREHFQRMREDMQKQVCALNNKVVEDNSILNASSVIAHQIAIYDWRRLIKPCMLQASEVALRKQAVQKLKVIPVSVNTVKCRIK